MIGSVGLVGLDVTDPAGLVGLGATSGDSVAVIV